MIRYLLMMFLFLAPAASAETLLIDDFETGLSPRWEEKVFSGRTRYRVVNDEGNKVLRADSAAAAMGLIFEQEFDPKEWPILSWRWKIADTIPGGDARTKKGDDYAARIYVIFPHWFFPKTRSINYIWANRLPKKEMLPNAFTGNAMMLAVESGAERRGEWIVERRDIVADYRRLFGEDPPQAGAIAIMSDTDNTGASATAWYDDLQLESR
ncbi:MAG: hypothetical protein C0621_02110 [Desulfuromonas sp.]|nr:MAG: hypothetical protein C0621_02110 [Desulfuromonas sp.]